MIGVHGRFRVLASRIRGWLTMRRLDEDFERELDAHLGMLTEENIRRGLPPEEARRVARVRLGGITQLRETHRELQGLSFMETLIQDTRYGVRMLRKNPGFTAVAVFVLALGICASVAIFAFVDAALIKPLPYPNPTRLVDVTERVALFPRANLSYLDYLDWKKLNKVFTSMDVWTGGGYLLSAPGGAQVAPAARVSDGFFRTLGVAPVLGRDFYAGEDLPEAPRTVMLSYTAWHKWFGGRQDAVGQQVTLSGVSYTIIGVLPRDFYFAPQGRAEFWATLHASSPCEKRRNCHNLYGLARLKDGVSVQTALADMTAIAQRLERQYPDSNRGQGASVVALSEAIIGDVRPILLVLIGGAGLLLLIACVNVASLLLVRSENRKREIAVRSVMGASTARLLRHFATEGLILASIGTTLGVVSAEWVMHLTRLIPADGLGSMPYLLGLDLNFRVMAFAGAIWLISAALFSVLPSLRLSLSEVREGLMQDGRGYSGTVWHRFDTKLVVVELSIAVMLLVSAGLLGKSFYRLLHVDVGFQSDHLATLELAAPELSYAKDEQMVALGRRIVSRIADMPGIRSVGIGTQLPVSFNGNTTWIRLVGKPYNGEHNEVNLRDVSSAYFTTLQAKLLRGRYFTDAEDASKPRVAIINQALAKKYFPGEDAIGKKIGDPDLSPTSLGEIVGIVDNIREGSLDSEIWPAVYVPFNQSPSTYFFLAVRTSQAEESVLPALGAAIHQIDPNIGTISEATMRERINGSQTAYLHRSSAWLVGGFAAVALLLGVVGLYGVIAYSVSRRTREIGMRMALGAQRNAVYQLILREAVLLAGAGIALGLVCSLAAARLMRGLLFGTRSWDVTTLTAVSAVLAVSALLASYIPARRAMNVDPMAALRHE